MTNEEVHPERELIIAIIRTHVKVGRGTCSPIDECYSDDELVKSFGWRDWDDSHTQLNAYQALEAAIYAHEVWVERYNDIRGAGGLDY